MRHVLGGLAIRAVRPQLQPSLGHLQWGLFGLDGELYTGDMSAQVVHLLQGQRVLGLQLAVRLGGLSYPGGEALRVNNQTE